MRSAAGIVASIVMNTCAHVLVCPSLFAQATGQLRFRFEPDRGVQYVLDGKYRMSDREITLSEGSHRFVLWAPERLMLDTSFFVVGGRTVEALVSLHYSPEYVSYRRAVERHELQARWGRTLPPVLTAAAGVWTAVAVLRWARAHRDLNDLADSYRTSADPLGITRLKEEEIPAGKDDLRAARNGAYVATGMLVLSASATWYLRRKLATRTPPVFEDRERVRFEGLVNVPGERGVAWAATFSMPLQ